MIPKRVIPLEFMRALQLTFEAPFRNLEVP